MVLYPLILTLGAHAHSTFQNPVGVPGGFYGAQLRVPHGCAGSPTLEVTVTIPDGVISVKPQAAYGWSTAINTRPLLPSIVSEGKTINTTVDTLVWTAADGSPLLDEFIQDFYFQCKLPLGAEASKIYFPVQQRCAVGWNNWTQIPTPGGGSLSFPAPSVTLLANGTTVKLNYTQIYSGLSQVKNSATAQPWSALSILILMSLLA